MAFLRIESDAAFLETPDWEVRIERLSLVEQL
jgi:hypothetical protein